MLYQTQHDKETPPLSPKILNKFVRLKWLPSTLAHLRDMGIHISVLYLSLLQEVLMSIQTRTDEKEEICNFAESLINEVLDSNMASLTLQ